MKNKNIHHRLVTNSIFQPGRLVYMGVDEFGNTIGAIDDTGDDQGNDADDNADSSVERVDAVGDSPAVEELTKEKFKEKRDQKIKDAHNTIADLAKYSKFTGMKDLVDKYKTELSNKIDDVNKPTEQTHDAFTANLQLIDVAIKKHQEATGDTGGKDIKKAMEAKVANIKSDLFEKIYKATGLEQGKSNINKEMLKQAFDAIDFTAEQILIIEGKSKGEIVLSPKQKSNLVDNMDKPNIQRESQAEMKLINTTLDSFKDGENKDKIIDGMGDEHKTAISTYLSRTFDVSTNSASEMTLDGVAVKTKAELINALEGKEGAENIKTALGKGITTDKKPEGEDLAKLKSGDLDTLLENQKTKLDAADTIKTALKNPPEKMGMSDWVELIQLAMALIEAEDWETAIEMANDLNSNQDVVKNIRDAKKAYQESIDKEPPHKIGDLLKAHINPKKDNEAADTVLGKENTKYRGLARPLIENKIEKETKINISKIEKGAGDSQVISGIDKDGKSMTIRIYEEGDSSTIHVEKTVGSGDNIHQIIGEKKVTGAITEEDIRTTIDSAAIGGEGGREETEGTEPPLEFAEGMDELEIKKLEAVKDTYSGQEFSEALTINVTQTKDQLLAYLKKNTKATLKEATRIFPTEKGKTEAEAKYTKAIEKYIAKIKSTVDDLIKTMETNKDEPVDKQKTALKPKAEAFKNALKSGGMQSFIPFNLAEGLKTINENILTPLDAKMHPRVYSKA